MPDQTTSLLPRESHGLNRTRIVLLVVALNLGSIFAAVDSTIVTTLLGHIASDLNALDSISWVATSYTVAYSAFQPIYGKLSDIWGRKIVLMSCTAMFSIGCLFCGIASGMGLLITGRFVSGIGAGGLLSTSSMILSDYFTRSRGVFQGIGNVSFGAGASLGGWLGGWMTSLAGWRFAFLVQVPWGILCLCAQFWLVHDKHVVHSHNGSVSRLERIDWTGSLSLVSSLLLSMFGLTAGGTWFPWLSWQICLAFASSLLLLVVFVYWETRQALEPVMPLEIMTHRTVISACLCNFCGSALGYAFLYYTPIFLQAAFHYTYKEIGHRVIVNFVGVAVGSLGTGILMRRSGKYYWLGIFSCLLMALSPLNLLLIPYVSPQVAGSPIFQSFSYFVNGLGGSGSLTVGLIALISSVEPHHQATTTAAQYTFRGAGSSLGIAVAAAIFQNVLGRKLVENVGTDTKLQRKIITRVSKSLEAIWDQPKQYQAGIVSAYSSAGLAVQVFIFCMALAALACAMRIREHPIGRTASEHARQTTPPGPLVEQD